MILSGNTAIKPKNNLAICTTKLPKSLYVSPLQRLIVEKMKTALDSFGSLAVVSDMVAFHLQYNCALTEGNNRQLFGNCFWLRKGESVGCGLAGPLFQVKRNK
jgi:hypothetical protein